MDADASENLIDEGLRDARRFIREEQRAAAARLGVAPRITAEAPLDNALRELRTTRAFEPTSVPGLVRRGSFRYDRATEERRIRISEDLIRRVDPGPYEDATYLALLAYQAASVELELSPQNAPEGSAGPWSKFLLGIIPSKEVNAFATVTGRSGYTIVEVHAALIDFIYQSAKAVVAAQRPARSTNNPSTITAEGDPDHARRELDRDDEPARHLYRTLEAYLFHGRTRAFPREEIPEEHGPPLSMLIAFAERFVIAHEYGHGAMDHRDSGDSDLSPAWAAEFQADNFGMCATVLSACKLDQVAPEFPLAGALFAIACLDVLRRALSLARDGIVPDDTGSATHPPNALRADRVSAGFHELFRVEYGDDPATPPGLALVDPRNRRDGPDEAVRQLIDERARSAANILFVLWERVHEMLLRDHAAGRRLHPMWYAE